ncbi:hypothetical protein GOV09_05795 [Candidatus Woesearchaeota archaeon]|nr:hypothetical protein [Candidatus Woesearchaeota archaeon]
MIKRNRAKKFVEEALDRGHSLKDIKLVMDKRGYSRQEIKQVVQEYEHPWKISNNTLAVFVIVLALGSLLGNYYLLQSMEAPEPEVTAMVSIARATFCVNAGPTINTSDCNATASVNTPYDCEINATDTDIGTAYNFTDNTTLFDINSTTGEINFTPTIGDIGSYHINFSVFDGSGCSNEYISSIFNLTISLDCGSKQAPQFTDLGTTYNFSRKENLSLYINASDPDNDSITINAELVSSNAYTPFNVSEILNGNWINFTPTIAHVGWHLFNISVTDNSSCQNDTSWQLVNVTVWANNSAPQYIGSSGDLDYTLNEDTTVNNVYNLDDYFNDSDGDCLKYEISYSVANPILNIVVNNNDDPRDLSSCPSDHLVTLIPSPNQFGTVIAFIIANDTLNVSEIVTVTFTILNVAEVISLPTPSSGGGGGGPTLNLCNERWTCTPWNQSECVNGFMTRECDDLNDCHTTKFQPNETKICQYIDHCSDGVKNFDEDGVDCGGSCQASCSTCFDAVMNCHKLVNGTQICEEGVDCGGLCQACSLADLVGKIDLEKEPLSPTQQTFRWLMFWILLFIVLAILTYWTIKKMQPPKKKSEQEEVKKFSALWWLRLIQRHRQDVRTTQLELMARPSKLTLFWEKATFFWPRKAPDYIPNLDQKIKTLRKKVSKNDNEHVAKKLGEYMKLWLAHDFNIEYSATYEELSQEMRERKKKELIHGKIEPFFDDLVKAEFSGRQIADKKMRSLITTALSIMTFRPKPRRQTPVVASIVVILALLGAMFLQPDITGLFTFTQEQSIDVFMQFNASGTLPLDIIGADSISIDGWISQDAEIYIYAGDSIVLDSSLLKKGKTPTRTDVKIPFTEGIKQIDAKIDYGDSAWDPDNDGVEPIENAVDVSVKGSLFNGIDDKGKLCTLWEIENDAKSFICNGNVDCCALLETLPENDEWDEPLFLSYGKHGAKEENIVWARIYYINYNLDPENAYSEIVESEQESISVYFEPSTIGFEKECVESCSFTFDRKELKIELMKGELFIEKVHYGKRINAPPLVRALPNISSDINKEIIINLKDYIEDAENDSLSYAITGLRDFIIAYEGDLLRITPPEDYEGQSTVFIIANDSTSIGVSNLFDITVRKILEETVQEKAEVGKPVKWIKKVHAYNKSIIKLDHVPMNVTVQGIEGLSKRTLHKITVKDQDRFIPLQNYLRAPQVVGVAAAEDDLLPAELMIDEDIQEIEIEYYTEAPELIEEEVTTSLKKVVISSPVHYENITAFTAIDDKPRSAIHLFRTTDGIREKVSFEAFDENANGLIDKIEWIVPHLSNQTYEVEISVLNVQSYPTVGGIWEVRFNTTGKANLTISAINNTLYGSSLPNDLLPDELQCGFTDLNYTWEGNDVTYNDYECNQTGYWKVIVLTEGVHNQQFTFGDAVAYANNLASVNGTGGNLTVWDDSDLGEVFATDNVTFSVNYTNGFQISNGTCEVEFNLTGSYQNKTNMTYNGVASPWTYNRSIPYKGTSYFHVICQNATMPTLNVTDSVYINNTSPTFNKSAGKLPSLVCVEDTPCEYNMSKYVIDPDLNDDFTFDYGALSIRNLTEHPDCSNCWVFNFDHGKFIVNVTTSDHANQTPWSPVVSVLDSDGGSDSATVDISMSEVNDYPVFTNPSGISLTDATAESVYNYDVDATDEEDITTTDYNFTILSCQQVYLSDCSALNVSINRTTGIISGTPGTFDPGNYTLNLSTTDNDTAITWKLVNLSVIDVNNAPVFDLVCAGSRSALEDSAFNCTINASDADADPLTFGSNYSWFTLDSTGARSVLANFTPTNAEVGNYTIKLNVTDGLLTTSTFINFSVNNTNDVPYMLNITNQLAVVNIDFRRNVSGHDDDLYQPYNIFNAVGDTLSFTINLSFMSITKINATSATMNFTPASGQEGNYSVLVNVSDNAGTYGITTFNLTIRNNTAPIIKWICDNDRIIQEEEVFKCWVNATDIDGDNFTFSTNGTWFNINATSGNVSMILNDSDVGNYTIRFTATDSWGSSSLNDTNFTVNNTPEFPYMFIPNINATQNETLLYNLSANVTDEDQNTIFGDILHFYSNGSFSGNFSVNELTGLMNFTPDGSDGGIFYLNITVNDSAGLISTQTIILTVELINYPPELDTICDNLTSAREDVFFSCTVNATDANPSDNLTFNVSIIGGGSWFNINASGYVNFTPINANVGNHTLNFTVYDGVLWDYRLINFSVNNTNDAPVFDANPNLNGTEDILFNYTLNVSDDDLSVPVGENLSYFSNSTFFTVNQSTGQIVFIPNSSQVGNYSIKFNVSDLNGSFDTLIRNFTISFYDDFPVLQFIPNLIVEELSQLYHDVNATDEEDAENLLRFRTNASAALFVINVLTGEINFTANASQAGIHHINLTVNDTIGRETSQVFNLTVTLFNFDPNITTVYPYGTPKVSYTEFSFANRSDFPTNITSINLAENNTYLFNVSIQDGNGDNINYSWYKNGTLVYSSNETSSFNYSVGLTDEGLRNITVIISDGRGGTDRFSWNATVNNSNRKPLFGVKEYDEESEFSGTENDTNVTSGGIILAVNGSVFANAGDYVSLSIDMGALVSSFYNPIGYTTIEWVATTPADTSVTAQTRTSDNGVSWGNWSSPYSSGSRITSTNTTYIQYKLNYQTNNTASTPNVTTVRIRHIIPDLLADQGDTNPNWIDLDDYFIDIDTEDTLQFTVTGYTNIQFSISSSTHVVGITIPNTATGEEVIYFTVNDSYDTEVSNNITITINETPQQSAVEIVTVTTTKSKTVIKFRPRDVEVYEPLQILVPQHLTSFDDETMVAPIKLSNMGESLLTGITLSAGTNAEGVELWFSRNTFDSLSPGTEFETDLFMRWTGLIAEFDVIVNATSIDPVFTDSAIVSVTGIKRVESNRSIVEDHISFVRDLLANNPRCLELNELVEESEKALAAGDLTKARNLWNFVINGCRTLLESVQDVEQSTPIQQREGDLFKIVSGVLLLLLFITAIIILALARRKKSM